MKKLRGVLAIVLLGMFLLPNFAFAADCRTPANRTLSLNKSGQHSATTTVSGITLCPGMSGYENTIVARVTEKVGVRPSDAIKWYAETSATTRNKSKGSKTQTVTPAAHYLLGAKGSWDVTCNICHRSAGGRIEYKN